MGSSEGQFYEKYLKYIKLNEERVDWSSKSFDYLKKEQYDEYMKDLLGSATTIQSKKEAENYENKVLVIPYEGDNQFIRLADSFGIMNDEKVNIHP
jgi:alpha-1,3-mannosyl-glycoprotein beta-1,2-N-acetylglucosaminyltransferase